MTIVGVGLITPLPHYLLATNNSNSKQARQVATQGADSMKIITTTKDQFINIQINEWGFDYVEEMFDSGYEPCIVEGRWCWVVLPRAIFSNSNTSNSPSVPIPPSRSNLGLVVTH